MLNIEVIVMLGTWLPRVLILVHTSSFKLAESKHYLQNLGND